MGNDDQEYGGDRLDANFDQSTAIIHCYSLATRIYLNRIVLGYNGSEFQHRRLISDTIATITQLSVQTVSWPFLIAACEAQTDEQRQAVLEVRLHQDNEQTSTNTMLVLRLVKAFWNLADLDTEGRLGYRQKLSAVISGSPFLPVLA